MLEGKGSFGVVYSDPILPFIFKFFFEKKDTNIDNIENINKSNDSNIEVSKVFIDCFDYSEELKLYQYILKNYNIDEQYFNIPLNFGEIDQKDVRRNMDIYNSNWSGDNNAYILSSFQITFRKGLQIKKLLKAKNNFNNMFSWNNIINDQKDSFNDQSILIKFKNIFLAVKFLNNNLLLYDDFKLDNIIQINEILKFSDFSSLIHINELNYEYFMQSKLNSYFYFIYNCILNKILYLFLGLEINKSITYVNIDSDLYTVYNDIESKKYIDYCTYKFNSIKSLCTDFSNIINIPCYSSDDDFETLVYIDLNANIIFGFINNENIVKKNYIYIKSLYKYLKIKFKNITSIKTDIIKRINIYSLGINLLELLSYNWNQNIINLALLCSLHFFNIGNIVYITDPDIDSIYKKYQTFV